LLPAQIDEHEIFSSSPHFMTTLSFEQAARFREQGYLHLPGAVASDVVDAALHAINHSLGNGIDPAELPIYRSRSFCPELLRSRAILDLYERSSVSALMSSLVGAVNPISSGQIALRFPGRLDAPAVLDPHLDGMYTPSNGVTKGKIHSFTALVGVALSDVHGPWSGNLTVWPGTHAQYEEYFRAHGPESLLHGMPPIRIPEPVQLTARAGDAFLLHYQLAHTAAPNFAPHIRYAVYFRVTVPGHDARWQEAMTDVWLEWPGMR
jgi:hypothetical protein